MRRLLFTGLILTLVSGCALRPRYRDFINETTTGPDAKFVLYEKDSDKTLNGVKLEMSEWKNKIFITTGPDGSFALPVDKRFLEENPVIVVVLPPDVMGYEIEAAPTHNAPVLPPVTSGAE